MAAARSTLGSGWTSATNPTITAPVTTTRTARGARSRTHSAATHATTMTKWPPDTAVTCVSDVVRIASSSSGSSREVSPPPPRHEPACLRAEPVRRVEQALPHGVHALEEPVGVVDDARRGVRAQERPVPVHVEPTGDHDVRP